MQLKLVKGAGSPTTGACWMSALSYYAGYEWSDHPKCVDPLIRWLCIVLNDNLPDSQREAVIGPHLMAPIGTNHGRDLTVRRAFALLDRLIRVWVPARIDDRDDIGLDGFITGDPSLDRLPVVQRQRGRVASRLRGLEPITNMDMANRVLGMTGDFHTHHAIGCLKTFLVTKAPTDATFIGHTAGHATVAVEPADQLALILDLCAMGERTEIPQVRDLCALPQACR